LLTAIAKRRSLVAGSKATGARASCISLKALRSGKASASARGVGVIPPGVRMNSSSLSMFRSRVSA
jgi:hypothetical protein